MIHNHNVAACGFNRHKLPYTVCENTSFWSSEHARNPLHLENVLYADGVPPTRQRRSFPHGEAKNARSGDDVTHRGRAEAANGSTYPATQPVPHCVVDAPRSQDLPSARGHKCLQSARSKRNLWE